MKTFVTTASGKPPAPKKPADAKVKSHDLFVLLLCTMRHSFVDGKGNNMVDVVERLYGAYNKHLSSQDKRQMFNEINEKIVATEFNPIVLGDKHNQQKWAALAVKIAHTI